MLHPKNNINKNIRLDIKPISGNTKITLGNVIHNQPIITKLNDVIQQNNPTISNQVNHINQKLPHNNYSSSSNESNYSTELIESSEQESSVHDSHYSEQSNDSNSNYASESSVEQSSDFSSSKSSSESSEIASETKLYWEYGNTGLKINDFNKKMSKNLAIMNYIDQLFCEYSSDNLNYIKLFSDSTNKIYDSKIGIITAKNGIVNATLKHSKLSGTYNILETGLFNLSDIQLTKKDLKHNSIPNLEQLLTHKDNIYHITKIIKLFELKQKITIKSNTSTKNNSFNNISQNANKLLNELVKNNKKNKILKSNKHSGFYIKIYNNCGKGFIIDEKNNIIYYITNNMDFKIGNVNIRYYAFNIKNGKIIKS